MTQIIENFREIVTEYDAFFCDVWGVLHNGQTAFAPAVEALMEARLSGASVTLVTNSPKTPSFVASQLARMKVPETAFDAIVTAGEAMQYSLFNNAYKRFYFIGNSEDEVVYQDMPDGVVNAMERTEDYNKADVILCAGPDTGRKDGPEDYEIELRQLASRKLPMFCANPDIVVDMGDRRIWCAGALAQAYEQMGGVVYQFGKPFPPIYDLARQKLQNRLGRNLDPSRILFIGDGIDTDLKGANLEEMDFLFVSGGLAAEETGTQAGRPDNAKLQNYLAAHGLDPRLTMGALRW